MFADILALPARPGRDQNFFVLGGHSLLVVRLAAALSGKLDRKVPLPAVFANPTAAGLAGLFTSGETQNACVIRTLRHGTGPAAFLFHAVDGSGHCYDQLAGNWHGDRHINVVEQGQGFDSLETLAEGYAQAIDTAAGDGDTVMMAAIEAGAEDVESSEDGHIIWCLDTDLNEVSSVLEAELGESLSTKLIWKPTTTTELDLEGMQKLMKLVDALEDDDDVQRVTANFEASDEVMDQL